jgi:hypothetical protein
LPINTLCGGFKVALGGLGEVGSAFTDVITSASLMLLISIDIL